MKSLFLRHLCYHNITGWFQSCGLYYKHVTIINDDSSVINKLETLLTGNARAVIYDCHMFIVQATGLGKTNFEP